MGKRDIREEGHKDQNKTGGEKGFDRRKFIMKSAGAGAGLIALASGADLVSGPSLQASAEAAPKQSGPRGTSRVALVKNKDLFKSGGSLDAQQTSWMLAAGMGSVFDVEDPAIAWKKLFKPDDVVGIKVNCIAGPAMASHPVLVDAIVSELKRAGLPAKNIIIWDRKSNELVRAGYTLNVDGSGVRCYGTEKAGYEKKPSTRGSFKGSLSKILTQRITALINVPILKDHSAAGVTISMKNHYGSFNNPRQHHGNHCDPFVADLNSLDEIKGKTRLIVCDATRAQCNGGPGHKPAFVWKYGGIIVSTDSVALDTVGAAIIEERRAEIGLPTLEEAGRPPLQLASAAARGLGNTDMGRIDLRTLLM
jgi:uncharacterized protein (DUF362 family)